MIIFKDKFNYMIKKRVEPRGLGDVIGNITYVTGIDKIVQATAKVLGKDDCGCNKRKEKLNKIFPFKENEV